MVHISVNDDYSHGVQEPQLSVHPQWVEELEPVTWEKKFSLVGAVSRTSTVTSK